MKALVTVLLAMLTLASAAPADYLTQRKAALALAQANQHDKALEAYIALADLPDNTDLQRTDALRLAVTAACRVKLFDKAGELAQRIPLEPFRKAAQLELLGAQWKSQAIIDQFASEPIETWPSVVSGPALLLRGRAFSSLKRGQEAENDLKLAAGLISQSFLLAEVCNERASNFLVNLQQPPQALASYRKAIEVMDDSGSYLNFTALVGAAGILREQQQYDEAMKLVSGVDAVKLGGYWGVQFLSARAAIHQAQGRKDLAAACYQQALDLPNLPDHLKRDVQQKLDSLQKQATP
jgi:tetratricopeptide (TPR) repeat protein